MLGALQRKASAAIEAAVDQVDRGVDRVATVAANAPPLTPSRQASAARNTAALAEREPSSSTQGGATGAPARGAPAAGPGGSDAAEIALNSVPKSDVVALCVKTSRRLKALEMQYADLKAMHQALLDERRQRFAPGGNKAVGNAGGAASADADAAELDRARAALGGALAERDSALESASHSEEQHLLAVSRAQALRSAGLRAAAETAVAATELGVADGALEAATAALGRADGARRREEGRFLERVMSLQAELATLRVAARKAGAAPAAHADGADATAAAGGGGAGAASADGGGGGAAAAADTLELRRRLAAAEAQAAEWRALVEARSADGERGAEEALRDAAGAKAAAAELERVLKSERAAASASASKFHAQLSAVAAARAEADAALEGMRAERDRLLADAAQNLRSATGQMVGEAARERHKLYARIEALGAEGDAARAQAADLADARDAAAARATAAEAALAAAAAAARDAAAEAAATAAALATAEATALALDAKRAAEAAAASALLADLRAELAAAAAQLAEERAAERGSGSDGRGAADEGEGSDAAAAAAAAPAEQAVAAAPAADLDSLVVLRAELAAERDACKQAARARDAASEQLAGARAELQALTDQINSGEYAELAVVKFAAMQAGKEEELKRLRSQLLKQRTMLLDSHSVVSKLAEQDALLKAEMKRLEAVRACAETLNVEYLRNLVVKLVELVFADSEAQEMVALVRAIQTALHCTSDERERVERCIRAQEGGWWGAIMGGGAAPS